MYKDNNSQNNSEKEKNIQGGTFKNTNAEEITSEEKLLLRQK